MLVPVLAGGLHIPGYTCRCPAHGSKIVETEQFPGAAPSPDTRNLSIFKKHNVARVVQKRGHIRGNKTFSGSHADQKRCRQTCGIHCSRLFRGNHGHGIRSPGATQGTGKGFEQRRGSLPLFLNKTGQNFRIRIRNKGTAGSCQLITKLLKILDNSIMDNGQRTSPGKMRMRVALFRRTVRSPAGMSYAAGGYHDRFMGKLGFQSGQLACGFDDLKFSRLNKGHS